MDELPTLYFHKIDRLIGTARSNKVSVTLGFQELPQLEADYGKVGMQKIITTVGNVVSGSARAKETLEWLSNDIFGKVVQIKKGRDHRPGQDEQSISTKTWTAWCLPRRFGHGHRLDMRSDGTRLREDENRCRRFDEHPGIGRVQDHEVLLQDGF